MARRNLAVVRDEESTPEPPGNPDLTRETMHGWKVGQRRCRARKRHDWRPLTVWEYRTYYLVIERCKECGNKREAEFNKRGRKLTDWAPHYKDGYLLPKGAQRITEDLHDELMLADILSRPILEALDEEEV